MKSGYLVMSVFCMLTMHVPAQDAWKKITVHGEVAYQSVVVTTTFDDEGAVISKTEYELHVTTGQELTFFVERFPFLSRSPAKLAEFNQANANFLMTGGNFPVQETSGGGNKPYFPLKYAFKSKTWETCYNEDGKAMKMVRTSEGSGTVEGHASRTTVRMIQTHSPDDVFMDSLIAKSMDRFAAMVMAKKKAEDIKAGKKINETDYFMPANLYYPQTVYGNYLFTSFWRTDFGKPRISLKERYYDCDLKEWRDGNSELELTVPTEERLEKDYEEAGSKAFSRYIRITDEEMAAFVSNPQTPRTFTGGRYHHMKDSSSETETRTIITLTVGQKK